MATPERFNFAAHLFHENHRRADKVAYVDDHRSTTYGELEAAARRFASLLTELGVRTEERILLFMQDTVELPIAFLGALYAGVIPVVTNTMVPPKDLAYFVSHSRARLVLASLALEKTVAPALDRARAEGVQPPSIMVDPHAGSLLERIVDLEPAREPAPTQADDLAFWLYSSGSTGSPKAVVHTHGNLLQTVDLYGKPIMGVTESDTVLSGAKLFFAYGLGNALTFPLAVGARVILMAERATPDAIFKRLIEHRVTIFCGAPTTYVALLAHQDRPSAAEIALRVCTSAGEALPESVGLRFQADYGAPILDGIGSTEMLHIYISNRLDDLRYGSSGKPCPGYAIELRDADGQPVPAGEIGELWVKGPSAAVMYWRDRERSRATFVGAWMKTGDKYRELPSGHYEYAGRSDDMLKVSGQYVAPVEVEFTLMAHPSVLEAAVVGKNDASGLLRTWAYVVLRQGITGDDALVTELQAHVRSRLAPHKYPRHVVFTSELPKTATGKVQRFKLRES